MLSSNDTHDLIFAMRASLLDDPGTENYSNYIKHELTYEQLLNICFNPDQTVLLESVVVEENAIYSICNILLEKKKKRSKRKVVLKHVEKANISTILFNYAKTKKIRPKTAYRVGQFIEKQNLAAVGIPLAIAVTGVGAWYIYRKSRKQGATNKVATTLAAEVAKKKAEETGTKKDKKISDKWNARLRKLIT
jgi:hypothetical protein